MRMYDIICDKKNKCCLTKQQIEFWIDGVVNKTIPDYQTSALLMAILLNGMNDDEIFYLTDAMIHSGEVVDLSKINGITCDKHSTGGVGDSTTFVILPILASLGLKCAKMSGRALGHTGGTLDKLEAIDGFRVELTDKEFFDNVNKIGLSVIGQTANICPADKILYALRDVTATVDSIPLIASSIMSKKIAGGSDIIVLDVKCGSGAFLKNIDESTLLAEKMVSIGKKFGKKISAVITDMNEPLDNYIGNSVEILGAIKVLLGEKNQLSEVSFAICKEILTLSGLYPTDIIDDKINEVIENKSAYRKFIEMIALQGGDIGYITDSDKLLAKYSTPIISNMDGYISSFDTEKLGIVLCECGAGRLKITDEIDHFVGLRLDIKIGDKVVKGKKLGTFYYNNEVQNINAKILETVKISCEKVNAKQKILKIIR